MLLLTDSLSTHLSLGDVTHLVLSLKAYSSSYVFNAIIDVILVNKFLMLSLHLYLEVVITSFLLQGWFTMNAFLRKVRLVRL